MDVFVHEDKISFKRRLFGVVSLSLAFLILGILFDFKCLFQDGPCGTSPHSAALVFGIFFSGILILLGGFFGFFHGKQVVCRGHLMVENYLFGIRFRRESLANLSDYNEVRVSSQKGFGQMTYHIIVKTPEKDVFIIELVGHKGKRIVAYLQDVNIAKPYSENLVKATGFPLKEVLVPN